ncbi:hypothetical protein D3C81_1967090 [compost metagenome]
MAAGKGVDFGAGVVEPKIAHHFPRATQGAVAETVVSGNGIPFAGERFSQVDAAMHPVLRRRTGV